MMREGIKNVSALGEDQLEKLKNTYKEIGMASGQVLLDKVIEMTKDMDRDQILRFMSEMAASIAIKRMNTDPEFRMRIKFLMSIL